MSSEPRLRRLAFGALTVVALTSLPMPTAFAAGIDGTLSGTTVSGDVVTTSLSLPASAARGAIDASGVVATVGGRTAKVEDVSVSSRPRLVVLLVDTSGSMRSGGLDGAKSAGRVLVQRLPAAVQLGVVSFSDQARVVVRPTTDRAATLSAIERLDAKGETALYDGVMAAVKVLGRNGDRRILLLSDGGDTVSSASLANAVRALDSGVTLDAVAFRTDESQGPALRALASAGHGRVVNATTADALAGAFADTAREIASQVQIRLRLPSGSTGSLPLVVTAATGQDEVTARSTVQLGASSAADVRVDDAGLPTRVLHASALESTPWPLIGVAFALVLLSVLLLLAPVFESSSSKRTRQLELYSVRGGRGQAVPSHGPSTGVVVEAAQGLVHRSGKEAAAGLRLDRAGMALRPAEWLVLQAAVALGTGAVLTLVAGSAWWTVVGIAVGVVATEAYVRLRVRRRLRAFERQLPDVLTLVASSLATGFSLHQSLDAVAQDAGDPVSTELYRALAETRIGAELTDALDRLAHRMNSENMRWTSMALRIQQQVGGNLAETLRTTAATLREREQIRRMVRGLSAEGRLSAYILIGLPIGIFFYMLLTNHDYISLLWNSLLGWLMLGVALIGMLVGSFWMSRVVKVEV